MALVLREGEADEAGESGVISSMPVAQVLKSNTRFSILLRAKTSVDDSGRLYTITSSNAASAEPQKEPLPKQISDAEDRRSTMKL